MRPCALPAQASRTCKKKQFTNLLWSSFCLLVQYSEILIKNSSVSHKLTSFSCQKSSSGYPQCRDKSGLHREAWMKVRVAGSLVLSRRIGWSMQAQCCRWHWWRWRRRRMRLRHRIKALPPLLDMAISCGQLYRFGSDITSCVQSNEQVLCPTSNDCNHSLRSRVVSAWYRRSGSGCQVHFGKMIFDRERFSNLSCISMWPKKLQQGMWDSLLGGHP